MTQRASRERLEDLLQQVRRCRLCEEHLPLGPKPVVRASETAKLVIIGQAPGARVHHSGIPFDDPSGDRLRDWLGMSKEQFYDVRRVAIVPMGFCYPGRGKSGDLPPRRECAPTWHARLLALMPAAKLVLLVGRYAQRHYLVNGYRTLTETVRHHAELGPRFFPLPHPSPRNLLWLKKNPWFERDVLPALRQRLALLG